MSLKCNDSSNRPFVLFTELRVHAFGDMFLKKLKSDLENSVSSFVQKRTTKHGKTISLLYLCVVWSEPLLFESLSLVNGLVHGILALSHLQAVTVETSI